MAKGVINTVKLGFFIIIGVILFTVAAYLIGNQDNLFQPMFRISAIFHDANGLKEGNNVRYAGIVVGSVEEITLIDKSTLQVFMKLDRRVKEFIMKDAVATIEMEGLVGNMIINISPGSGKAGPADEGDIINSDSRPDVLNMLKTLNETNENLKGLTSNLLNISENLEKGEGTIPRLLHDKKMGMDMAESFENVRKSTEKIDLATRRINEEIDQISEGKGVLGFLLHDERLPNQMVDLGHDLDSLLMNGIEPLFIQLQEAGADIGVASSELKSAAQNINRLEGLAKYLLTDTVAVTELKNAIHNVQEGTARFNETMEALQKNVLVRGYFKKKEKEK